jgi:hypothetical protein
MAAERPPLPLFEVLVSGYSLALSAGNKSKPGRNPALTGAHDDGVVLAGAAAAATVAAKRLECLLEI